MKKAKRKNINTLIKKMNIWNIKTYTYILLIVFIAIVLSNKVILKRIKGNNEKLSQDVLKLSQECKKHEDSVQREKCWERIIKDTLENSGIDKTFDALAILYEDTRPQMSDAFCHDLTHTIGEDAYILFKRGRDFGINEKSSYCNYGFFHGVIEIIMARGDSLSQARDFCHYVDEVQTDIPEAFLQCYHGIGHGVVNVHDPARWGDEKQMVDPALELCEQVSENDEQLWRCATGVYDGLAESYRLGLYELEINDEDPYWLCRETQEKYKETCYMELNDVLLLVTDHDFAASADIIATIPEDEYAQGAMRTLPIEIPKFVSGDGDYTPGLTICRNVQERLRLSCVVDFARQLTQAGLPGDELTESLAFCASDLLTDLERQVCYEFVLYWNGRWFAREKAESYCDTVEDEHWKRECMRYIDEFGGNTGA